MAIGNEYGPDSLTGVNVLKPVYWTEGTGLVKLVDPDRYLFSDALDLNDSGTLLTRYCTWDATTGYHNIVRGLPFTGAFRDWTQSLLQPFEINNSGQILAYLGTVLYILTPGAGPYPYPSNVTGQVTVKLSIPVNNTSTGYWEQSFSVKAKAGSIPGPIYVVMDGNAPDGKDSDPVCIDAKGLTWGTDPGGQNYHKPVGAAGSLTTTGVNFKLRFRGQYYDLNTGTFKNTAVPTFAVRVLAGDGRP
jgi:hypothetical protein